MLKGALFDFDGTIFVSEHIHRTAIREIFFGHFHEEPDPDELKAAAGIPYRDRFRQMLAMRGIDDDLLIEELKTKARSRMAELLNQESTLVPGITTFIQDLQNAGVQLAIVSSAKCDPIERHLRSAGLYDFFSIITGRDSVEMIKPHPQPYEQTLKKMGPDATEAIAFEDSPTGVESARLAGIPVIGLLTTFHREDLSDAVKTIHDFTEISVAEVQALIEKIS